jgi:tetratricopeptide (TPR) repeat protein
MCVRTSTPRARNPDAGRAAKITARLALGCLLLVARAAAQQGPRLATLVSQAQEALKQERFADAERVYEQILKLNPRSAEAHSNLGIALYGQGRYDEAIPQYRKALELNPALTRTRILLALTYFNTNRFRQAIPLLERAYTDDKGDSIVVQHLGLSYLKIKEDTKAFAWLSKWVELEPKNPDALYYKGQAALYLAVKSFEQLKETAPDSVRMHQLQAELFHLQGQIEPAITELREAAEAAPNVAGIHYALGALYWENFRHQEALGELQKEFELSPHDPMTNYLLGDTYFQLKNYPEALKHVSRAVELQPNLIDAQLVLAKLHRFQGSTGEAIKVLQTVARMAPERPGPHYMLFEIYRDGKDIENAQRELEVFQNLKRKADLEAKSADAGHVKP